MPRSVFGTVLNSDQTVCEMQCCVWIWCWSGTEGKSCKVSWFRTVTHWNMRSVIFVLFTEFVNNKVVPAVYERHDLRALRNVTSFRCCLLSTGETVLSIFRKILDIYFLECQYNIYRLLQNIFPAYLKLQMRRYQDLSNKYFYSVKTH